MLNALAGLVGSGNTLATVDWSTLITADSFNGIISGITGSLIVVIPACLTIMGIPIVWGFIRKMIKKH